MGISVDQQKDGKGMEHGGVTGSMLKWIAISTMLIDHIGAAVLGRMLWNDKGYLNSGMLWYENRLSVIYTMTRLIGRLAFPIFCFLLVEGFEHTHNKKRYMLRLGIFALVSEIPFDLVFNNKILEFSSQNVFFTLFIGFLTMYFYQMIEENYRLNYMNRILLGLGAVALGMGAAQLIRSDYGGAGVFCIMMLYLFQKKKVIQTAAGVCTFAVIFFPSELPAVAAFIPIWFYNGKRGKQLKYFFYIFYPAHLLILYLICVLLGISRLPAM